MKTECVALVCALVILFQFTLVRAETIVLRSGKPVEIIDGTLTFKGSEEVLREASDWLKKGRIDYAREYWKLLIEKGKGAPAAKSKDAQDRLRQIEYESFVILSNQKKLKGKINVSLRSDLLGLERKEEIPIWQVEEIVAEYHPGLSRVTKTFFPLTLLEIKLRGKELQAAKTTAEIEFVIESASGSRERAILGKVYELLRPEDLDKQIDAATKDRIIKVVVYPGLTAPE